MTYSASRLPATGKNANTSVDQLSAYVRGLAQQVPYPGGALLADSYAAELNNANKQQARWRRIYYNMRSFVIIASALITALAAFNLHGTLAFAFRVATLTLSALVTISTGLLELLQVNNRWRLYRQLRTTLEILGWQTAAQAGAKPDALLAKLGSGLIKAMRSFEVHYISQVATAADSADTEPDADGKQEPSSSGHAQQAGKPKQD